MKLSILFYTSLLLLCGNAVSAKIKKVYLGYEENHDKKNSFTGLNIYVLALGKEETLPNPKLFFAQAKKKADFMGEYNFENGVLNGPFKIYTTTGILIAEGTYKTGFLQGDYIIYTRLVKKGIDYAKRSSFYHYAAAKKSNSPICVVPYNYKVEGDILIYNPETSKLSCEITFKTSIVKVRVYDLFVKRCLTETEIALFASLQSAGKKPVFEISDLEWRKSLEELNTDDEFEFVTAYYRNIKQLGKRSIYTGSLNQIEYLANHNDPKFFYLRDSRGNDLSARKYEITNDTLTVYTIRYYQTGELFSIDEEKYPNGRSFASTTLFYPDKSVMAKLQFIGDYSGGFVLDGRQEIYRNAKYADGSLWASDSTLMAFSGCGMYIPLKKTDQGYVALKTRINGDINRRLSFIDAMDQGMFDNLKDLGRTPHIPSGSTHVSSYTWLASSILGRDYDFGKFVEFGAKPVNNHEIQKECGTGSMYFLEQEYMFSGSRLADGNSYVVYFANGKKQLQWTIKDGVIYDKREYDCDGNYSSTREQLIAMAERQRRYEVEQRREEEEAQKEKERLKDIEREKMQRLYNANGTTGNPYWDMVFGMKTYLEVAINPNDPRREKITKTCSYCGEVKPYRQMIRGACDDHGYDGDPSDASGFGGFREWFCNSACKAKWKHKYCD